MPLRILKFQGHIICHIFKQNPLYALSQIRNDMQV
jgi:hypothetical protein